MKHFNYTKDAINLLSPVANEAIINSRGKNHFDQPPGQRSAQNFVEFIKVIGTDRGNVMGEQFICSAMGSGLHQGNPKKYIGENNWRLAALAQLRLYLPLDVDGVLASMYKPLMETLEAFVECVKQRAGILMKCPEFASFFLLIAQPATLKVNDLAKHSSDGCRHKE